MERESMTARAPGVLMRMGGLSLLIAATLLGGCTTVLFRAAVPEDGLETARPYGIEAPLLRAWGDGLNQADVEFVVETRARALERSHAEEIARGETIRMDSLALSGGGPDGAFGAGLLAGWTARGDRPEFQLVTGVSTGAIIALFAFLGPEYDDELREIYTEYTTKDLATTTFFSGLTGGTALFDTSGYRRLIDKYIDDEIVAEIAEAYRNGRVLLIGTTNIDASRPVNWNVGAIAASGDPKAKRLIRDVIQASSAIPAAFPPVLVPVNYHGQSYDEMHVDGGATQQVILFSPELRMSELDERTGAKVDRRVWVVVNNKLRKPYDPVRPRVFDIAAKAGSSLIGGSGSGDVYRIYAVAERDGAALEVISIPPDFSADPEEMFDPVYMGKLYQVGYDQGLSGEHWSPYPPGFAPPLDATAAPARVADGS
ncbi:hypothetical protein G5B40_09965 [Pikeienuella piscinae]|uniref:PNPLA domain-containing protein n=1 Tax=Pikeienuella piscinae TaxID=2748098 RepID=A0A7L5BZQ7_9RHOB|nr:patatin-like phospholipase family protein [Pikeienuella piscinae]QIE55746.1 hypothetical protein G5B40_09965 [Pikeienuella piscinae]